MTAGVISAGPLLLAALAGLGLGVLLGWLAGAASERAWRTWLVARELRRVGASPAVARREARQASRTERRAIAREATAGGRRRGVVRRAGDPAQSSDRKVA